MADVVWNVLAPLDVLECGRCGYPVARWELFEVGAGAIVHDCPSDLPEMVRHRAAWGRLRDSVFPSVGTFQA